MRCRWQSRRRYMVGDSTTATQIAQNSVFERFARAGYVVSGLLHLIIGYLAIRIALGVGSGTADQSGALAALTAKPGGIVALWVALVALVVMGLWRCWRSSKMTSVAHRK